jgi:hypothetical protein
VSLTFSNRTNDESAYGFQFDWSKVSFSLPSLIYALALQVGYRDESLWS